MPLTFVKRHGESSLIERFEDERRHRIGRGNVPRGAIVYVAATVPFACRHVRKRVAEPLLIRHPPAGVLRVTRTRNVMGAAMAATLALVPAACQRAGENTTPIAVSDAAQATIQEYLPKVEGRFGALAMSRDGSRAVYYICQSRLWKNCDDYELNDRFVSIPSARLAGREALSRCGGGCSILYLNGERQS